MTPLPRAAYRHFLSIPTRWMDNDVYGHVNNVVYYSYFDTVVNEHLIQAGALDPATAPVIGVVLESQCRYHRELSFPEIIDGGLAVAKLGRTSVIYKIGLFRQGEEQPAASGRFVHVYIDRQTRRPMPIPAGTQAALRPLCIDPATSESS